MTRRVRRMAIRGIALATLLATVASCGALGGTEQAPQTGQNTSGPVEKAKITLGVLPILDVASVHVAIKKGYFAAEGLEVNLKVIEGGAKAIPGLINKELDFTFGNWVSFFAAQSKDVAKAVDGIKLISDGYQAKPDMFLILVSGDSAIKSPADLAGKTIAINTFKNIAELTAKATLEAANVDVSTVKFKEMAFPDMQAAVQNKSVDAAFMVEPFITRAQRAAGQIKVLDAATGPTDNIPIMRLCHERRVRQEQPQDRRGVPARDGQGSGRRHRPSHGRAAARRVRQGRQGNRWSRPLRCLPDHARRDPVAAGRPADGAVPDDGQGARRQADAHPALR